MVGLTEHAGKKTRTLSGGQRRRLDVAIGLVGRPELLFLDELTAGLDPQARREWQYGEAVENLEVRRASLEDSYLALVRQAESGQGRGPAPAREDGTARNARLPDRQDHRGVSGLIIDLAIFLIPALLIIRGLAVGSPGSWLTLVWVLALGLVATLPA